MPTILRAALVAATLASGIATASGPDVTAGLEWRLVGPHRAGWTTAAAGPGRGSDVFYMGAAGGGVWKTDDAGKTWDVVFDGVGSASVGALAVARSAPDVVYVGMGQVTTRYDIAVGDGVYRSADAGRTWTHAGLAQSRHIGAIAVDPTNADVVLVAALGSTFGPDGERGVYRSTDGGRSWQRTLAVSEDTGVVDVAMDPSNPSIVYAASWQVRYRPWLNYFTPTVGPESGLFRSTDGGITWTRLEGGGWPKGPLGRIGVAVSPRDGGSRVWAVVDAEAGGGLYRSDDGGRTWLHVNSDPELVNGYFARITAIPGNPDAVYSTGRSLHLCTNGGTTCEIVKGAPGGDDYHDLWIDPDRPERMITGADQGTAITVNGGRTWTDWYNLPTGQLYKIHTDDVFPYRIYAGQQDNGTVRIASRSDYGSITYRDWEPVGADERDYDIPDPRDPDIVYGSGLGGRLTRWNARNGEMQNITPWPISSYGSRPTDFQQRYSWITPIAMSKIAPYPLYLGSQYLWRTTDQGATWERLGPDLSAANPKARDCKGDLSPARARECGYGVVWSIGLSRRDNSEIWVGTDDGVVRLTRDGGRSWSDVTPKGVPHWAKVATIEPSPTTPGTAYAAVDNHRQDDFRPYVFRTRDYGRSWTPVTSGLPADHFVGVVRADTVRAGLLYAGTDEGVYVSFDDGDRWQSLQRNLPVAWVRDIAVHDDDVIVATQGRAIWVLDDVSPLRQHDAAAGSTAYLYTPSTAIRVRKNQNHDTPLPKEVPAGTNPPTGAVIDYWLATPAQRVELEVHDASDNVVRRWVSDEPAPKLEAERYFAAAWLEPARSLPADAGMHRWVWDLRLPRPHTTEYEYSLATAWGQGVPLAPGGPVAPPGKYRVVLRVDGVEQSAPLNVVADPRVPVDPAALAATLSLYREVAAQLERQYAAAAQTEWLMERLEAIEASASGNARVRKAIDAFAPELQPLASGDGDGPGNLNLSSIGGTLRSLASDLETTDRAPTAPQHRVLVETTARLDRALARWNEVRGRPLDTLNASLAEAGVPAIDIPPPDRITLKGPSVSREIP